MESFGAGGAVQDPPGVLGPVHRADAVGPSFEAHSRGSDKSRASESMTVLASSLTAAALHDLLNKLGVFGEIGAPAQFVIGPAIILFSALRG